MVLAFGTILGVASWIPRAAAGESERAGRWQGSIPITFTSGSSFDSQGTSVDVNDDLGWGFGFGYHLDDRFMVGADFTWLSANYRASIAQDGNGDQIPDLTKIDVSGTLDAANLQFVGQYNILKGRITPFLRASFGWTWVDSNIPAGLPVSGCYWDPWWGYICSTYQPTFEDTSFAYGAAAGLRAELTDRFFLEGSYNVLWVDFNRAGTQSQDGVRLNAGWTF
jgi:opacity protein-like surface antigen